jgi:hypothetical protein
MINMTILQKKWFLILFLCGFILIELNAQEKPFQYLDMNTILKDKKILAIKQQLPAGWEFKANGSQLFLIRKQQVIVPFGAVRSTGSKAETITKMIGGKKVMLLKTQAFILFTVEKKMTFSSDKPQKFNALNVFNSDYYTFMLWEKQGYSKSEQVEPQTLMNEFDTIVSIFAEKCEKIK